MDEPMLVATWWGVGVASAIGIGGLVVGLVGLVQAKHARGTALDANAVAQEANALSVKANLIADEANTVARTSLARQGEHHVAEWRRDWANAGMYRLTNLGPDTAHTVTIEVSVDDESKTAQIDVLERDEYLLVAFPRARDSYYAEIAAIAEEDRFRQEARKRYPEAEANDTTPVLDLRGHNHQIRGRVRWQTDAGTVREENWDDPLEPLM
ncbi:hypothetical protein [uncultured Microbacterium sp.]|uniref:hypothetical protein n=1 Tax=uncultured Microbacterium sp. TaxID=191216 RepID=UPI0025999904|nr:hypothetical protein [uncultured Microbacterium sp.]